MNSSNLWSLRNDMIQLQKDFLRMKTTTEFDLPSLQCHQCQHTSTEILPTDPSLTFSDLEIHLTSNEHIQKNGNRNFHIYCTPCRKFLTMTNSLTHSRNNIIKHLESQAHKAEFRRTVDEALPIISGKLRSLQLNFDGFDAKLNDLIGKFSCIMEPPKIEPVPVPVPTAPAPTAPAPTSPAPKYHPHSSVKCYACKCTVSTSSDNDAILNNSWMHLQGGRHSLNIDNFNNKKSFWCCRCECLIPISEDIKSSFYNIEKHVNGRRHSGGTVTESETDNSSDSYYYYN